MRGKRLIATLRLYSILSPLKRTAYLRDNHIFARIGEGSMIMDRILPLYPELIKIGDNVHIASNVNFVTHDVTHMMLNRLPDNLRENRHFQEQVGCIEIGNNVFIGSGTRILYNVKIGSNCVVGANSLINKDIPDNSVVAGAPCKVIGSFHDYLAKRSNQKGYPPEIRPIKETIPHELANMLWEQFDKQRE